MNLLSILAQTPPVVVPGQDQFDQWLNRGVAGAVMCLLAWVISRGIPNIISSFKEETKDIRTSHAEVVKSVSEGHARAMEAVVKDAAVQRDQFKATMDRTVDKFTDTIVKPLMEGRSRADGANSGNRLP